MAVRGYVLILLAILLVMSLVAGTPALPASAQENEDAATPSPDTGGGVIVEPELSPFEAVIELVDYQFDMQFLEGTRLEGLDRYKEGSCNFIVPLDAAQREALAQTGTAKAKLPAMCSGVWLHYFDEVNTVNRGQSLSGDDDTVEPAIKELSFTLNLEDGFYRSPSLKPILFSEPVESDGAGNEAVGVLQPTSAGPDGDKSGAVGWGLKAGSAVAIAVAIALIVWRRRAV